MSTPLPICYLFVDCFNLLFSIKSCSYISLICTFNLSVDYRIHIKSWQFSFEQCAFNNFSTILNSWTVGPSPSGTGLWKIKMNLIYLLLLIVSFITQQCSSILQHQSPSSLHENILAESEHHCVVIYDENETLKNFAAVISSQHVDEIKLLNGVNIFTHLLSTDHPYIHLTAVNSTGSKIFNKYTKQMPEEGLIGVVKKRKIDRTCLLKNTLHHHEMTIMILDENVGDLLEAINKQCETYFDADGRTTNTGRMRDQLLLNRYGQDTMPEDITCEYIDETPSKHQFLHKYLSHSRPVVIRNAVLHYWTALDKWTNDWLRREFGAEHVNIKLTPPVGVFEGVEDRALWNGLLSSYSVLSTHKCRLISIRAR